MSAHFMGEDVRTQIAETVLEQVRQVAPNGAPADLNLDSPLCDAGLDSLKSMEVVNRLEQAFGIRFAEESLYDLETCGDLVDCVEATMARRNGEVWKPTAARETAASPKRPTTDVPLDAYDVTRFPEVVALQQRLSIAAAVGLANPFFRVTEGVRRAAAVIGHREVISYARFDYLGMATATAVVEAAKRAVDQYGTSAAASRLVGGELALLDELDGALASLLGVEAAVTFPSGYGTNASILGHLFGAGDLIVYDELCHNSMVTGAMLSPAARRPFPHNDWQSLDSLLSDIRGNYRRVAVLIEGVYSMDGDYPDLPEFIDVKRKHKALLYVDEAHSVGVMGPGGRGICDHFDIDPSEGDLWMGTISKALGSGGGYIAGRRDLIQYLKYTAPSFVFATACSPANAAAALTAVRLLGEEPERVERLRQRSALFLKLVREAGFNTGTSGETPIVPVILGDSSRCLQVSQALLEAGIDARPILYPAVPESATRVRFFITAEHTEDQIRYTVDKLVECMAKSG